MRKYSSIKQVIFITAIFICFQFFIPLNVVGNFNNKLCISIVKAYDCNLHRTSSNIQNSKEVFLTFDDGPCINNTRKILKILKDSNVKATFFIVGMKGEENPQLLKEISDNGMSIGIHTYSHDYSKIYKNISEYFKDYDACEKVIKKITGRNPVVYIRMPGGSDNLVASKSKLNDIKKELNMRGLKYVDWNVSAGDAESRELSAEKVRGNVIDQCKDKKMAIVLMHDTYYKNCTVEALPDIIEYLKNEGFVFRTFDDLTANEEDRMVNGGIINRI